MRIRLAGATVAVLATLLPGAAQAVSSGTGSIAIRPELEAQLRSTSGPNIALISGVTTAHAVEAARAAGLTPVEVFDRLGVVVAAGAPEAVRAVHRRADVRRVDANVALELYDDVAHRATGAAALRDATAHPGLSDLRRADGTPFDGSGVSIAVVDEGFDESHEQFRSGGASKFDVHLRQACPLPRELIAYAAGTDPSPDCAAWVPVSWGDSDNDEGHGTIVAGAAAGYPRTTPSGEKVRGAAPGARLVGLSIGGTSAMLNAVSAMNWILEHHSDPCGDGSCAPIRVVNASWGLAADDDVATRRFDPGHPLSRATTALVEAGVVVVFAAGNSSGNGSMATTNFFGLNPIPGFLMVGSYFDGDAGDGEMLVSGFSSRGKGGEPATYPDLLAPGESFLTGCARGSVLCSAGPGLDGDYGSFSGTSIAAPYMSGVVAQMIEADPSLTPEQIEDILEDTAHPLGPPDRLEPDVYTDAGGNTRGNSDHLTSFDSGHGNVDLVRALSRVLDKTSRQAPSACPREPSVAFPDPAGDARIMYQPSPVELPAIDVVGVAASLAVEPGALQIEVTYKDLGEVATTPEHTSMIVSIDRGGSRDPSAGAVAEITLDRTPTGDVFGAYSGPVRVEGTVDAAADTATFIVRPLAGPIQQRASLTWIWTSNRDNFFIADGDLTGGACTLWMPENETLGHVKEGS